MFGIGESKAVAGLDVGSSAVKAVQLRRTRGGYEVICAGLGPVARNAIVDGAIADATTVAKAIEAVFVGSFGKCFGLKKLSAMNVAASLSGPSVIVKRLTMPVISGEDLGKSIREEVARSIPFDIDEVSLSYQILGETETELDVLLVAARNDKIQSYTKFLTYAGKPPRIMDVDALALQNCFEANYATPAGDVIALVNIGNLIMNINIIQNGKPLFTRDVPAGGAYFTEALEKDLGINFDQASEVKTSGKRPNRSNGAAEGSSLGAILEPVSQSLILDIKRTFEFFRATTSSVTSISSIYVAGGTAKLAGLLELMRVELGLPVETLNPFQRIAISSSMENAASIRESAPEMAVAVGLGLRGVEG